MTRLIEDPHGELEINKIHEAYEYENKESGIDSEGKRRVLIEHLVEIFPNAVKERKKTGGTTKTLYKGIKIGPISCEVQRPVSSLVVIKPFLLQNGFSVTDEKETMITCRIQCNCTINGEVLYKTITFFIDGHFMVKIGLKEITLRDLYISDRFYPTKESIRIVSECVKQIRLCEGVTIKTNVIITRFHSVERSKINDGIERRKVRSILCDKAVTINSVNKKCNKCKRMILKVTNSNKENENLQTSLVQKKNSAKKTTEKETEGSFRERLKLFMPGATEEMIDLMQSQRDNMKCDPRGRRWSEKIISVCLQWYCRSPQSYEAFRSTNFLILPSPSTLVLYKNKIKHEIGIDDKVLEWMHQEAMRKEIPKDGWVGGIILDEMSIQSDIQISKSGDVVELSGLVDIGEEANACHVLRTNKNQKSLGTHALQMIFLGVTGFRFPFAHFITDGIQGPELYPIFWEAVDKLNVYGFRTLYTCMDGAQSNRNFMNYNLGPNCTDYKTPCPCFSGDIIFTMDSSHVFKKIRNNILKSGISSKCTRLLTLPSSKTIQWQMFIDCFKWDKSNSFQLHKRLTNEHFFLSSHSKMRNHLAEEVLNVDMHHTMSQYKIYLGDKGEVLDGVLELLSQTSKLINIFHDMRPITQANDNRLKVLKQISDWFHGWKNYAESSKKKDRAKFSMSYQCHDDIQSCIIGFIEICNCMLKYSKDIHITPALINSDVVENIFNQQRSTYNGANSNPNALQYRRTLNSIILGQNSVSIKANAGKGKDAAMPFNFSMKRTQLQSNQFGKKLKK